MFRYEISHQEHKTVVSFIGDLDIEATELFQSELTPELLKYKEIEIDFSGVPFVDSTGIGLLISLIHALREKEIPLVIKNVSEDIQQIFSLLQLPEMVGRGVFADF